MLFKPWQMFAEYFRTRRKDQYGRYPADDEHIELSRTQPRPYLSSY